MIREWNMEEVSDGKKYSVNDMVKVGCNDCKGCSSCCQGMGESIVLDPFDCYQLARGLGRHVGELLQNELELHVVDGVILPNLKMAGESERCVFLNEEGRCSVHQYRPGICRIFPLGRLYENDSFVYFLQKQECPNAVTKVKVSKWIDVEQVKKNQAFIAQWHYFLRGYQDRIATESEAGAKAISMAILRTFYLTPYDVSVDFYEQFEERLQGFAID